MGKKTKIAIGTGVLLGLGVATYFMFFNWKKYAKIIAENTGVDFKKYKGMDLGYLRARAKAFKNHENDFEYKNKYYITSSGKAK